MEGGRGLEIDPKPNAVVCIVACQFIFVLGSIYSAKKSVITAPTISHILIEGPHTLSAAVMLGYLYLQGEVYGQCCDA